MGGVRITGVAAAILCVTLSDCAIVDLYADRATQYNVEAEQAQEKGILLNIIRSSLRRPLQFTSVTSIAGSTSATGGGGYSGPVNAPFRNSGGVGSYPSLTTWSASGSMTGSETFTVPVLDTQEFYQGILRPIPSQFYDLLVQQRYPPDMLFNLFIQKVIMRDTDQSCAGDHTDRCEFVFANYVGRDDQIALFQMFAHFLIRAGLTTESADRKDSLLKGAMNINVKLFGATNQAGAASGQSGSGAQSSEPLPKNYVFCFAPRNSRYDITAHSGCGAPNKNPRIAFDENSPTSVEVSLTSGSGPNPRARIGVRGGVKGLDECNSNDFINVDQHHWQFCQVMSHFATKHRISLVFYTKSTEAVIYYLGEVARRQLYPDQYNADSLPFRLLINTSPDVITDRVDLCVQTSETATFDPPDHCSYLFRIENAAFPAPSTLWVSYAGEGYAVTEMRHGGGYTMSSLELVKQLLALFSSAKTLPSTTVLSVVNQ